MKRKHFSHQGLELSYLDWGGCGDPLLLLHAHWMEAITFRRLAGRLRDHWHVFALDQRGHGHSSHASDSGREAYFGDLEAWISHLDIPQPFVLLGHSLGGINAIQYTGRRPDRVRALIVEDIGARVDVAAEFILQWRGTFPTRDALAARVGNRFAPYLEDSFRPTDQGWTLAFDVDDIATSQRALVGDYWEDWMSSTCPAMVIRGSDSQVTTPTIVEEMARRRPHTQLVTLRGGHAVHLDDPDGFADAVRIFLDDLSEEGGARR